MNPSVASTTPTQERILTWDGCENVREVGGYTTADGQTTRWGAFVKADDLTRLTDKGRAALVAYGVRTVVDLRFPDQVLLERLHPYAGGNLHDGTAVYYVHAPINYGPVEQNRTAREGAQRREIETVGQIYALTLDFFADRLAATVRAIAHAPVGGVVVHCSAGWDRTGTLAAVILAALGVPDDVIVEDYMTMSSTRKTEYERRRQVWDSTPASERSGLRRWGPEAMQDLVEHLNGVHGGATALLKKGGLLEEDLALLRRRMLEPGERQ